MLPLPCDGPPPPPAAPTAARACVRSASWSDSVTTPEPANSREGPASCAAGTPRQPTPAARATVQPTEAADPLSGDPSTPTTIGPVIITVSFPFYITVASCGSAFPSYAPAVTATGATSNEVGR